MWPFDTLNDRLWRGQQQDEVRIRLSSLRAGSKDYSADLHYLRQSLTALGWSLEHAGTSEEELAELTKLGTKQTAALKVQQLRGNRVHRNDVANCVARLQHDLWVGGLSFEDVGTTEEEIMQIKSCSEVAQNRQPVT